MHKTMHIEFKTLLLLIKEMCILSTTLGCYSKWSILQRSEMEMLGRSINQNNLLLKYSIVNTSTCRFIFFISYKIYSYIFTQNIIRFYRSQFWINLTFNFTRKFMKQWKHCHFIVLGNLKIKSCIVSWNEVILSRIDNNSLIIQKSFTKSLRKLVFIFNKESSIVSLHFFYHTNN